ncbi:MAG: helix-turn-helix domain-containing protein [Gemmatimonadales bacterium]
MELRERILKAAADVYAASGFRGATTRRIAEQAGVNEVTLFRHFGSKTRLLQEAMSCAGFASAHCELPLTPVDPRAELAEWAGRTHADLFAKRSLIRTAMGEIEERPDFLLTEHSPPVCAGQALHAYLERLKTAGLITAEADCRAAAAMFMGTLFADAVTRDVLASVFADPPETSLKRYVDLFVRALGVEEPTP